MKIISFQLKITLLLLFTCFELSAEKILDVITLDEAKAHYLLEIIKHIDHISETDPIIIGLLGKNKPFHDAIQKKISGINVRNKTLNVQNIPSQSKRKNYYSVVLVTDNKLNNITDIFNRFGNVLIVVDGRVEKEFQFVSLIDRKGQIEIELNREKLIKFGFDVSTQLLTFAGTKEDLAEQLNHKQIRLQSLIEDAKKKRKIVEDISQTLVEKNAALDQIQITLEEKNNVLSQNISKLSDSKNQLQVMQSQMNIEHLKIAENKKYMSKQNIQLESKIAELLMKEQTLKALNANIESKKEILKQQNTELFNKSKIINQKAETINEQRTLLFVAVTAIIIISIFVYLAIRFGRMQKQTNDELNKLNDQLYELATTDSMTQLFNRRHFIESAQRQITQMQRTRVSGAMLMIDIDDFKKVNDTFGHAMGDEVIVKVAAILKINSRDYDLVGRVGGEEYAMLLSPCDFDKAHEIAERLRNKTEDLSIAHLNNPIKVTISVGLTMIKKSDKDIDRTMHRADVSLYKAKKSGKNKVVSD
jgi:diguanylate cyclase (GGDEF)-like protein